MSNQKNWQYPDWMYVAKVKLRSIDLSKFPATIKLEWNDVNPKDNPYVKQWAIKINAVIVSNDRITGKPLNIIDSSKGIYLYSSKNVEDVVYEMVQGLITHELRECLQLQEGYGKHLIPFDPHLNFTNPAFSAWGKVNGSYMHYPSRRAKWWAAIKRMPIPSTNIFGRLGAVFNGTQT